jgi:hypothetical protein
MRLSSLLKTLLALVFVFGASIAHAQEYVVPEVEVNSAPPPPRAEVQTASPGGGYTWIAGHWAWRGGAHVWMPGHWAMAPQQGMVWEPAHWRQFGPRWRFVEGHWRWAERPQPTVVYEPAPPPAQVVEVQTQPPAPIVEVRPATPFAGAVWIPGYWHWNGMHHVWVGGRYSAPRAGYRWEAHHWQRGPRGNWVMVPGRWVR